MLVFYIPNLSNNLCNPSTAGINQGLPEYKGNVSKIRSSSAVSRVDFPNIFNPSLVPKDVERATPEPQYQPLEATLHFGIQLL